MAGSHTRRNTGGAPINNSGTSKPTPAISCAPTPAPAQTSALAQAPASTLTSASVPGPPRRYTDENLQRATKLALELFVKSQKHGQLQANSAPREQPLKAWLPDLYYGNSHLDCYYFC